MSGLGPRRTRVAVVIPCFEMGRYLGEAVDSVRAQTRSVDELVVVDDGSRDWPTRGILRRLSREGVTVIRTGHVGLSTARNIGIRATTADYVTTLDADDRLDSLYAESTAACLDHDPNIGFVGCAMRAFEGADYIWLPNSDLVGGLIRGGLHATTLFRRSLFEVVGGFDPDVPAFETSDFWATAVRLGARGRVLEQPLLEYRVRRESKYHAAIRVGRFQTARRALLRKHVDAVLNDQSQAFERTASFEDELHRHNAALLDRNTEAVRTLTRLWKRQAALRLNRRPDQPLPPRPAILLYHRVGRIPCDARHLAVTPERFERDMRFLRAYRRPMRLTDLLEARSAGCLATDAVAVTFDDGYFDALTTIAPILSRYAVPATFFINSFGLADASEFWGDVLERMFLEADTLPSSLVWSFEGEEATWPVDTAHRRRRIWQRLNDSFYPLSADERRERIARLVDWSGLDMTPRDTHRRMTASEIRTLLRHSDFSLGAHSVHHLRLTSHGETTQLRELREDKLALEALTGNSVDTIAYPYGAYNDDVVKHARQAGFTYGLTVDIGSVDSSFDAMRIPRLEPSRIDYDSVGRALMELKPDAI